MAAAALTAIILCLGLFVFRVLPTVEPGDLDRDRDRAPRADATAPHRAEVTARELR